MLSNVRGEGIYNQMQPSQVQTPRPEMKMPPVGNFAPPPSVGKENKKRRGGAGSQITGGAAALDQASVQAGQNNNKNGNIRSGTVNKVSDSIRNPAFNDDTLLIIRTASPNVGINKSHVFAQCISSIARNTQLKIFPATSCFHHNPYSRAHPLRPSFNLYFFLLLHLRSLPGAKYCNADLNSI